MDISRMLRWAIITAATIAFLTLVTDGCSGASAGRTGADGNRPAGKRASDAAREFPLDSLPGARVAIDGNAFRVWLAREFDTARDGVLEEGLMHVPTDEIADDQGMLFVFSDERVRGFWMRNTIAPLDIAFARSNGEIVKIWQMPPLTLRTFSSLEPAMYALEVKQGTFDRLRIHEGDRIVVPDAVFQVAE